MIKLLRNPVFLKAFHGWATVFFIILIPIAMIAGLLSSVTFVSILSIWALVSGHWSAWQSSRTEIMADPDIPNEKGR